MITLNLPGPRSMAKAAAMVSATLLTVALARTAPAQTMPVRITPVLGAPLPSAGMLAITPCDHSAFPYSGSIPGSRQPFLDTLIGGRWAHRAPRGGLLFEDEAYSDRRSLLFIPARFDPRQPAVLVVFFHGNGATLARDVVERQGVPRQLAALHLNAVLVAPQLALDALNSSAGHFWERGFSDACLDEAGRPPRRAFGRQA